MEWTRPGIRRHFDFQGEDQGGRKKYMITVAVTHRHSDHKIGAIHIPSQQDGWSMEVPQGFRYDAIIKGLKDEKGGETWFGAPQSSDFGIEPDELFFTGAPEPGQWGVCLDVGKTVTITFQAHVSCTEPLIKQTLTLRYYPDLPWEFNRTTKRSEPVLPSPYYSSNLELEKGHLA